MTKEQLELRLREFPGVQQVQVIKDRRLIARVLAAGFDGLDEAERQSAIWEFLRKHYTEAELASVEFILTDAPADPAPAPPP